MKENRMGTMPVAKLLVVMSLPIIASMFVQALYNVVDTYFISSVSQLGVTALGYAFPIQNIMIGLAVGIGVGMNALVSKALGQKNRKKAAKIGMQGILIALCSFVVFFIIGMFVSEPFMAHMVKNLNEPQAVKEEIISLGSDYLHIVCCLSVGLFLEITFERILQATGKTIYTMISQGSGAIINIALDYIFVLGKFGCPQMGVKGAAIATVIGQFCAAGISIIFNLTKNTEFKLKFSDIKPNAHFIGEVLYIGMPSVLMVAIGSVMNFLLNKMVLNAYGADPITVFAYYFKLQSFVFMPVFGLNNGMIPIIGYNYGAGHKKRLYDTVKIAFAFAFVLMFVGFLCFQLFPQEILSFFSVSESMMEVGVPALRTISISFLFAGICIVCAAVCQALGKSMYSFWVSFGRQLVALIPAALILSAIFHDVKAVWWAFPIAEVVSLALSLYFVKRVLGKLSWNKELVAADADEPFSDDDTDLYEYEE
ncbi:MAG: MATE family efflux transporter [Clostridia bacterium]|nr:MATE family efflux transporter [Clostridia bacterium]